MWHFLYILCFCEVTRKHSQSLKQCWLIFSVLLSSLLTGLCSSLLLTVSLPWLTFHTDCSLMLPSADRLLFSSVDCSLWPSFSRPSGLVRDFVSKPLWRFRAKTDKFSDWHPHTQKRMLSIESQKRISHLQDLNLNLTLQEPIFHGRYLNRFSQRS